MKISRSSRMRATGVALGTQVVSFSTGQCDGGDLSSELTFLKNTPLSVYFYCLNVEYPRPDCNNKDTTSRISSQCKDALYKLSIIVESV